MAPTMVATAVIFAQQASATSFSSSQSSALPRVAVSPLPSGTGVLRAVPDQPSLILSSRRRSAPTWQRHQAGSVLGFSPTECRMDQGSKPCEIESGFHEAPRQ